MQCSRIPLLLMLASAPVLADFETPASFPPPVHPTETSQRPWDLRIRASVGHNNNMQLVPVTTTYFVFETEPLGSDLFAVQADGVYRFHHTADVVAGLTLGFNSLWNEQVLDAYNFYTFNPGIFSTYQHNLSGRPATLTLAYDWRRENGHNQGLHALGLYSHNLRLSENVQVDANMEITASLSIGRDNFEVLFPLTPSMVRDATRRAIDFSMRYWLNNGLHNITAGFGLATNDAKGQDFSYDANNISLRFETGALNPVWLAAEFRYSDRDYTPLSLTRTKQQITTTLLQLLRPIDKNWTVDLFLKYERYDSNDLRYETDATQYGIGMSYTF